MRFESNEPTDSDMTIVNSSEFRFLVMQDIMSDRLVKINPQTAINPCKDVSASFEDLN